MIDYGRGARSLLPSALALLSLASPGAQADAPPAELTLQERFQGVLEMMRLEYGFPGATAAYVLPDGSGAVVATGIADLEAGTPMTPQSRMLAASIGKMFVGASVVALEREGKLRFDDPVSKWLGDRLWFPRLPNHDTMTVRQLLHHTSGLPDHIYMETYSAAHARKWREQENFNYFEPDELVAFVLDQPPLFKAGSGWAYTDTGYILLGLIIEAASDENFYEGVQRRFLEPLALTQTTPSNRRELPGLVPGYTSPDNPFGLPAKTTVSPGVMAWNPAREWTGGGFVSNPRDLVHWAKNLFEGRALPGDYLKDLLDAVPAGEQGEGVSYGAGVGIRSAGPNGLSYGHGGWIIGYVSSLRYYPKHLIAVAFQINTDVGVRDGSPSAHLALEERLAQLVIESLGN